MSVLEDKRYDELDWISRAVEPIENNLNEALASIPDVMPLTFEDVCRCVERDGFRVATSSFLTLKIAPSVMENLDTQDIVTLSECFKWITGSGNCINFEAQTLLSPILLVKIKASFDQKELEKLLGKKGVNIAHNALLNYHFNENSSVAPLIEIGDILGRCNNVHKLRSIRNKSIAVAQRFKEVMENNEWNIRNMRLADKVGTWIANYLATGNLADFTNICKIKVMTHKGLPIYSMEEEV